MEHRKCAYAVLQESPPGASAKAHDGLRGMSAVGQVMNRLLACPRAAIGGWRLRVQEAPRGSFHNCRSRAVLPDGRIVRGERGLHG
jgi:hypothetical protein